VIKDDVLIDCLTYRIANNRRFRRSSALDEIRSGAPALGFHRSGEWRPGNVEVTRNQGFRTWRCEILPGETRQYWLSRLKSNKKKKEHTVRKSRTLL
jgi:hypothetical protein